MNPKLSVTVNQSERESYFLEKYIKYKKKYLNIKNKYVDYNLRSSKNNFINWLENKLISYNIPYLILSSNKYNNQDQTVITIGKHNEGINIGHNKINDNSLLLQMFVAPNYNKIVEINKQLKKFNYRIKYDEIDKYLLHFDRL
jgi:hypothetical protein